MVFRFWTNAQNTTQYLDWVESGYVVARAGSDKIPLAVLFD